MGTSVAVKMPLAEFLAQPGETFHDLHELWDGQVVEASGPSEKHVWLQDKFIQLLDAALPRAEWLVKSEFYVTLPGQARRLDVGAVRRARIGKSAKEFFGSPELAVKVLLESNTILELDRLREQCFAHGCSEFWVVNMELRTVTVYDNLRGVSFYRTGGVEVIPLEAFGSAETVGTPDLFSVPD